MWTPPPKKTSSHAELCQGFEALRHAVKSAPNTEHADTFSEVMTQFFECAWDHTFDALSTPCRHQMLEQTVAMSVSAMVRKQALALSEFGLSRLKGIDLLHGSFLFEGYTGMFFWFENDMVGLVSLFRPGSAALLARMRGQQLSMDEAGGTPIAFDTGAMEKN
jgi:hypothetical protein